jgi:DNA-binding response OmpR family regulator
MSSINGFRIVEGPDVLVVDDDPEQARQIAGFLDKRGIAVSTETSGRAAISAIQRDSPKVVVMDVNMPTVDGIEVTRQAMAGEKTPIIILMSGEPEKVYEAGAAHLDVFAVVDKPVPLRTLETFIRRALARG